MLIYKKKSMTLIIIIIDWNDIKNPNMNVTKIQHREVLFALYFISNVLYDFEDD